MRKSIQICWLLAAMILLVLPFPLYNLLKENIDTENHENRELAEKPELDLLALADYPEAYDNWMNDNLPFRNQLVAVNSLISIYLFNESPSDRVIVGRDGWFFYNSVASEGSQDSIADFQGTNLYSIEELEEIKTNMVATRDKLADKGVEFILLISPNKEQIYADKMPDEYGSLTEYTRAQQVYDYLKDDITIVYVADDLLQAKEDYPQYEFYCHLDTHWNNLGAYVGTKALVKELGYDMPEIDQLTLEESTVSGMDLSSMMNLTRFLNKDVNYDITGYSENPVEVIEYEDSTVYRYSTTGADQRKVMVVRDSFGTALAPFLASQFNETVFFHRYYYDVSCFETEQPDVVIYQTVERGLNELKTYQIVE